MHIILNNFIMLSCKLLTKFVQKYRKKNTFNKKYVLINVLKNNLKKNQFHRREISATDSTN